MPVYHSVPLDPHELVPAPPSTPLAAFTPLEWDPSRDVMVAQDGLVQSGRRIITTFGLVGRATWPWDADASATTWPEDIWRRVWGPLPIRLTPGHFLRLRVLYVPSGATGLDPIDPIPGPATGAIRVGVAWANTNSGETQSMAYHGASLPAAMADGSLPDGTGGLWTALAELEIADIMPTAAALGGAAGLADYSEGTTATVQLELRGGARIVDAILYEYPAPHYVLRHDDAFENAVHGAHDGGMPPVTPRTPGPQEARRGLVLTDERRYGTHQTLRTAHHQAERLGPFVLSWGPWESDEDHYAAENSLMEDEAEPWVLTGTVAMREVLSSTTTYGPTLPAWVVAASQAQLHRYSEPDQVLRGGNRAVVPVRVAVRARWTGAAGRGTVRIQSSAVEWIDVDFDASGDLETREVVGWLESQAAADQEGAELQVFVQLTATGDSFELYGLAVDWGWHPS